MHVMSFCTRRAFSVAIVVAAVSSAPLSAQTVVKGVRERVGNVGEWGRTGELAAVAGSIWSLEQDGTLYRTDKSGKYVQLSDKGGLKDAGKLTGLDGKAYYLVNGTLFVIDPLLTTVDGVLYVVQKGTLYRIRA